jgi:ABC-type polysaccharide/polyol phosphate transport system ATPase subunit
MIKTENLCRLYYFKEKLPGLKGSLKHLFKPIKKSKTAVKDFTLSINKGELVGLIGPNGAGKTINTQFYISFDNFNPGSLFETLVFMAGANRFFCFGLSRYSSAGG